jgi:hypothetical protein
LLRRAKSLDGVFDDQYGMVFHVNGCEFLCDGSLQGALDSGFCFFTFGEFMFSAITSFADIIPVLCDLAIAIPGFVVLQRVACPFVKLEHGKVAVGLYIGKSTNV